VLNSSQQFAGVGVTSVFQALSRSLDVPELKGGFDIYMNMRGSVAVGTNKTHSDLSSTGASPLNTNESRTDYIPTGEVEIGVEFRRHTSFRSMLSSRL